MKRNKDTVAQRNEKIKKVRSAKFRLLPLVIFFCVLMLSFRVGVVWRNIVMREASQAREPAFSVTTVQAQAPVSAPASEVPADSRQAFPKNEKPIDIKDGNGKSFSQSELEILQKLAQRREELDIRERSIEQKAGVLKAAEAQMDVKIAKLKELEASIKDLIGIYDEK